MKRSASIIFALTAIAFTAQTATAQEWSQPWARERIAKSPRHSEWVTIKHDGRKVETLIVYPESKEKRPVVLIIHEIFGLSDWAQELADEVAEAGYIAVAPDLLSGMGPDGGRTNSFTSGGVTEAVSKLNPDQVTADLNAAADYGKKLPSANSKLFIARISPQHSSSTARRPLKTPCRASKPRFTASTPAMTRASTPPFPTPSPT